MNRKGVVILSAFGVICLVLFITFTFFAQHSPAPNGLSQRDFAIGMIKSVNGQVESRLPQTLEFLKSSPHQALHSQEVVKTDRDSEAVIEMASGTNLHMGEASKFVAEFDASRPGAYIGTIMEGKVTVLRPGDAKKFRLYYQGREVSLDQNIEPGPSIVRPSRPIRATGLVISATVADESAIQANIHDSPSIDPYPSADSNVLTNEDIVRQLRGQTGFFQRCYLAFVQRARTTSDAAKTKVSGTVVVSFRVLSAGTINDVKVVRADFGDDTLQHCLTEVVERARFKAFEGEPVPVLEFPITLN